MSAWNHRLAPVANAQSLKDPAWRKRVGFDSIMTREELEQERIMDLPATAIERPDGSLEF